MDTYILYYLVRKLRRSVRLVTCMRVASNARLQHHRHPQQRGHDRRGDDRRAEREAAAKSENANAGEGEDEGGIPKGAVAG